MSDNELNY